MNVLASGLKAGARSWLVVVVVLSGLASTAAVLASGSAMPLIAIDSQGYIDWSADRTPAYPLFLYAIRALTPDYTFISPVQYGVLVASTAVFADAMAVLLEWWVVGLASAVAVFGNFFIMRYPAAIAPESLYLSLVLLHAACVLHSLRRRGLAWPILAGLALGTAILFRPVGYALLFGLIWLPLVWRERRYIKAALLAASVAAMILIACTGSYLLRGYFATQAVGGINLILKIAPITPPLVAGFAPAATEQTSEKLRPIRESGEATGTWDQHVLVDILSFNNSWTVLEPSQELVAADPARWQSGSAYGQAIAVNAVSWDFARKVILANPTGYAALVARQVYGLWFIPQLTNTATARAVSDILANIGKLDRARSVDPNMKILPGWAYDVKITVFAVMLLASVYVIVRAMLGRDPRLAALAYLAILTHCYFFVVAGVEVALPRYSLMVWPFQCAVVIGAAVLLYRERRRWSSESKA